MNHHPMAPPPARLARLAAAALVPLWLGLAGCATSSASSEKLGASWPLPPDPPRVKWVRTLQRETDLGTGGGRAFYRFLVPAGADEVVENPTGLALSADEQRLYVACGPRRRVLEFDLAGRRVRRVADQEGYQPVMPMDVALDADDNLYVADATKAQVWVFGRDGKFQRLLGAGKLRRPIGLALDRKRQVLHVLDVGEGAEREHQIETFALRGDHLRTIGGRGLEPGKFHLPSRIAVAPDGRLFVADTLNFRVQVFDADGGLIGTIGTQGYGPGQFLKVKGVALDAVGNLHAVDGDQGIVQIFDPSNQVLMAYGGRAARPEFLLTPGPIVIDSKNDIWVADYAAHKVNEYLLFNTSAEPDPRPVEPGSAPSKKQPADPKPK
jgi:sugar lactone lactonase YvrE